ncbi:MAG TPA: hypothetical protein VHW73_11830, partial [Rudaea sp.]|nr:hypothetical protein [Rudaea sp.]
MIGIGRRTNVTSIATTNEQATADQSEMYDRTLMLVPFQSSLFHASNHFEDKETVTGLPTPM